MEIRFLRMEDIPAYTELYNLAEAHDPEFVRKTPEEMEKIFFRKPTDTLDGYFVAMDSGRMVAGGGGRYNPEQNSEGRGYFTFYVIPKFLESEIETMLFEKISKHLKESGARTISMRANSTNLSKVKMLERFGFTKTAYQRHHMERKPQGVPEAEVPAGFTLRNARMPDEMGQLLETNNEAYSTRNFKPTTFEEFSKFSYLNDTESLTGVFVMERISDGRIVGWVGSQIEHAYNALHGRKRGGSYSLVVIPSERGKGIGKALMQSSLRWLSEKGMETAYVGVNHQNPDALHLYKSLGYELVGIWQGFEREI